MRAFRSSVLVVAIVGIGLVSGGCATAHNVKDAPDFNDLGEVRFFGGVRTDIGIIASIKYPDAVYAFVDLPFSLVGDVVTAPFIVVAKQWVVINAYRAGETTSLADARSVVRARVRASADPGDPARGDPGEEGDPAAEATIPAPASLVLPMTHVVHRGESLWTISTLYYGHGRYWELIQEANPALKDRHLEEGEKLTIPERKDRP